MEASHADSGEEQRIHRSPFQMIPTFVGGPFDGDEIDKDMEGIDEVQIYLLNERSEKISVYVYSQDDETGNYIYDGEFAPEELEEEEDE
jgi:hypothetical protein